MTSYATFSAQFTANVLPGPQYLDDVIAAPVKTELRAIAFYLPQFHPIPENDAAWGKGFTEWTNVSKARPLFMGHCQPRLPGELGFYDLRLADNIKRQAILAKRYGIEAFCFHYYWFNGKRLLDTPIKLFLANPDIDISFCVNWANENWTRRWDGGDGGIIQPQNHSPEDDIEFARSIEPLMRDKRYLRINGRPLLLVYRTKLFPDAAATVHRWRNHFTKAGLGDPYIVMCQVFGDVDPRIYGMDAAIAFPPHGVPATDDTLTTPKFEPRFRGYIKSYESMAKFYGAMRHTAFPFFHCVCPGWDNTPRRPLTGTCFHGATPRAYGAWLTQVCKRTLKEHVGDERIVFINAWNEWAEGAYLEPDRHFGYAFLAQTARALQPQSRTAQEASIPGSQVETVARSES